MLIIVIYVCIIREINFPSAKVKPIFSYWVMYDKCSLYEFLLISLCYFNFPIYFVRLSFVFF